MRGNLQCNHIIEHFMLTSQEANPTGFAVVVHQDHISSWLGLCAEEKEQKCARQYPESRTAGLIRLERGHHKDCLALVVKIRRITL